MNDTEKIDMEFTRKMHMNRPINVISYILTVLLFLPFIASGQSDPSPDPRRIAMAYGISDDDFRMERRTVRARQNLCGILIKEGLSAAAAAETARKCQKVFDVRKMKAGNPYWVMNAAKADGGLRYLIYEQNPVEYVVFDLADPIKVWRGRKAVNSIIRMATGMIGSSLWQTFTDKDLDVDLVLKLAEIYAWTLDFYHLQKEDTFKIIYEENRVEKKRIGTGRILAACITSGGEDLYAFHFEKSDAYFDETGQSLRKAFLKAPLKFGRISSRYSKSRLHPILQVNRPHLGIDYAAPKGTPVMAVGDGIVTKVDYNRTMGRYIEIRHNREYRTQYLHLSKTARGIAPGQKVRQGDEIGYVGSTGLATGPHLDFRFWVNGKAVNFLKQDIPSADPVPSDQMAAFQSVVAEWRPDLDRDATRSFSAEYTRPAFRESF